MPIMFDSTNFLENIHHIDLLQYQELNITSSFLFFDGKRSLLFDCGTSDNLTPITDYMEKHKIPLKSIEYLVPSHHHFDHNGGIWKLIKLVRKYNPDAKILATELEKSEFQNPERHINAARSTYKNFVGTMSPPEDKEFKIYTSVINLNHDEALRKELEPIEPNSDLRKSVLVNISLRVEIQWKKNIENILIQTYSSYREKGLPNNLNDIKEF